MNHIVEYNFKTFLLGELFVFLQFIEPLVCLVAYIFLMNPEAASPPALSASSLPSCVYQVKFPEKAVPTLDTRH